MAAAEKVYRGGLVSEPKEWLAWVFRYGQWQCAGTFDRRDEAARFARQLNPAQNFVGRPGEEPPSARRMAQ